MSKYRLTILNCSQTSSQYWVLVKLNIHHLRAILSVLNARKWNKNVFLCYWNKNCFRRKFIIDLFSVGINQQSLVKWRQSRFLSFSPSWSSPLQPAWIWRRPRCPGCQRLPRLSGKNEGCSWMVSQSLASSLFWTKWCLKNLFLYCSQEFKTA